MTAFAQVAPMLSVTSNKSLQPTIADAQLALTTWTDLAPKRAQKLRTALSVAAKVLAPSEVAKSAAASLAMDCPTLSKLLQAPPATFSMSTGRRISLCSELRYILRRLGQHEPRSHGQKLRSKRLQACLLELSSYQQLAIIDLLRFLDVRRIAPSHVDEKTFVKYEARCATKILCAEPAARAKQAAAAWNRACQNVPNWPGKLVRLPDRPDRYSLPFESYPVAFQQDVDRYVARLAGQDIDHVFSDDILARGKLGANCAQRPLRPASITARRWIIRCSAAALVIKGVDQKKVRSLRDLVEPLDRPEAIIRFFLERRDGKSSAMADRVAQTLHLLARDYCDVQEETQKRITEWAKWVEIPEPTGLTEKNTRRLRVLMQMRVRAMMLWLPRELMKRADDKELKPECAARLAMYAVAMELLLICPMRRGNLAGIRLDRHLLQPDPRRMRFTHLLISPGEVKNDRAIHWPLPLQTQKLLERYLSRHRQHLVTPGSPFLFGIEGKKRHAQHLGEQLSAIVTREIGVEFNVHLARHFAAWNFLKSNPGQYEVIRQVLGHKDIKTTIAYYVGLEADSAAAHFDRTVLKDRHDLKKVAQHAFRRGVGGRSIATRGERP